MIDTSLIESSARPVEYLRDGFVGASGNVRDGINGRHSLAMAYRLLSSGVAAGAVAELRKNLGDSFQGRLRASAHTPVLSELLEAAAGVVTTPRAFAALLEHLERIEKQMAILGALRKAEPSHA
jgi:hypothetical protein